MSGVVRWFGTEASMGLPDWVLWRFEVDSEPRTLAWRPEGRKVVALLGMEAVLEAGHGFGFGCFDNYPVHARSSEKNRADCSHLDDSEGHGLLGPSLGQLCQSPRAEQSWCLRDDEVMACLHRLTGGQSAFALEA